MVLLIGANGSMGTRYKAILSHLGYSYVAIDIENIHEIDDQLSFCDQVILATPTDTHFTFLTKLIPTGKKILCEKPITKSLEELNVIRQLCQRFSNPITMVMQYQYLVDKKDNGMTWYDYFRTGKDGLHWDCLQIIAFAKSEWMVSNVSPIWKCRINGKDLSLADMDWAYASFIEDWMQNQLETPSMDVYFDIHKKVADANPRQASC